MAEGPPPIRKAAPPHAFRTPVRFKGDVMRCTVAYDPGNGPPIHAILLVVKLSEGRWQIVDARSGLAKRAGNSDTLPIFSVGSVDRVGEGVVEVDVTWPGKAEHALLLLLHEQVDGVGGTRWDKLPGTFEIMEAHDVPGTIATMETPAVRDDTSKADAGNVTDVIDDVIVQDAIQELRYLLDRLDPTLIERGVVLRRARPQSSGQLPEIPAAERRTVNQGQTSAPEQPFKFALASCQYPAGLVDGGIRRQIQVLEVDDIGPAEESLFRLAKRACCDSSIQLVVLAGDQVYVDATAGLFDAGALLDHLDFAYERMFRNRGLQLLLRTSGIDVVPIIDDHEIEDNWEPKVCNGAADDTLCKGKKEYVDNQRPMWLGSANVPLWAKKTLHGFDFFFADTRTERDGRCIGNMFTAKIMKEKQTKCLLDWIAARHDNGRPGFVVSPSILLPRRLSVRYQADVALHIDGRLSVRDQAAVALHIDSWCGYPASLYQVLAQLYEANARRVVFLSGDEHISCVTRFEIERLDNGSSRRIIAHSVHSSALYAPYPFANSISADFADEEAFEFDITAPATPIRRYRCTVKTYFPPALSGYAILRPQENTVAGSWRLDIEFFQGGNDPVPCSVDLG